MPLRFDQDYQESEINWNTLVDEVFDELTSNFMEMPKGNGYIEYSTFEKGYQTLKHCTDAFSQFTPERVFDAVEKTPISFVVFRCILGFTPSEWGHVTTVSTSFNVEQNAARAIDRNFRMRPLEPISIGENLTGKRIQAMIEAGIDVLSKGADVVPVGFIHRLDKVDTVEGIKSLQAIVDLGAPYPTLLYERLLGRPFASHRDSISELRGEIVEVAIKNILSEAKISFRETKRAERISGFDQAPDFIIPDEFTPVAIIEAKLTEDDGTARDKVSRIQRLRTLREEQDKNYDVIACIDGRGFKVRREDMKRILQATDGKVFTLATMNMLIQNTRIREYQVR